MNCLPDQRLASLLRRVSAWISAGVFLIGTVVLAGWWFDVPAMKAGYADWITMKPNAAVCCLLSALALWLLQSKSASDTGPLARRLAGRACAFLVTLVASLTLSEYLFQTDLRLDQLLFREAPGALLTLYPARMAVATALVFLLFGLALLLLDWVTPRGHRPAQWLTLLASLVSMMGFFGYLYGTFVFFRHLFPSLAMALPSVLASVALCVGTLAARPDHGLMALITSAGSGGRMVRRLLLGVFVLPVAFDLLTLPAERAGFYDSNTQAAITVIMVIVAFALIVYRVSWSLEKTECARRRAELELRERMHLATLAADFSATLTQGNDLPATLQRCAELLVKHLDVSFVRVWTLQPAENLLELQASAGLYTHLNGAHRHIRVGQFKIGLVAQERKPYLTNQVIGDPRVRDQAWAQREGMVAFAGYPLLAEGRLVGVIALFSRHPLSDLAFAALAPMASTLALGIEQKQIEERLRDSQALYHSLVENLPQNVFRKDPAGRITFANQGYCRLLGLPAALVVGRTDADLFPAELAAKYQADDRRVMETGTPLEIVEEHQTPDGKRLYVHVCKTPLPNARGEIVGVQGIFWDVTERHRMQEALRESEERFRSVAQTASDAIISVDEHDRILLWNQAAEATFGYPAAEAIGQPLSLIVPEPSQAAHTAGMRAVVATGHSTLAGKSFRLTARRKDHSEFPIELSLAHWKTGHAVYFTGIVRDITDRTAAEAERERLIAELRDALANVKTLSGLIPICAACKKIRDDQGFWSQVETYVSRHSSARFSHGICPDCVKKLYPDL